MTRTRPTRQGDERTQLNEWLDWQRATVRYKCTGVSEEHAYTAYLPSSPLTTMAGLVNHLRWVEHWWFEHCLLDRPNRAPWSIEDPVTDMRITGVPIGQLLDEYDAQCAVSREIAADLDLDTLSKGWTPWGGAPFSLRWITFQMISETARHDGHLDALRELADGTTGE